MPQSTSIPAVLSSFTETWSPRLIAAINDHHVKVAKIDGAFIWHAHPDSEELFYLLSGKLSMEIEGQDAVVMKEGDVFVVPKGSMRAPSTREISRILKERNKFRIPEWIANLINTDEFVTKVISPCMPVPALNEERIGLFDPFVIATSLLEKLDAWPESSDGNGKNAKP